MSKRRTYTKEFVEESVRHYRQSGLSYDEAAKQIGVSSSALYRWVMQASVDAGKQPGLTTTERQELTKLRQENRLLREEKLILKKATAFFAKESR